MVAAGRQALRPESGQPPAPIDSAHGSSQPRSRRDALYERLAELYRQELNSLGDAPYLQAHASRNSILRQIDVFERYLPDLPANATILDWGCHHAPDSCLIREVLGDRAALHGCDFYPPGQFAHFHGFAGLHYRQLGEPTRLPYEDQVFDVVISSGALEHVAMDLESLKELHRVLKEHGRLIITFLPNRLSYVELLARWRGSPAHLRLYGLSDTLRMLRHYGFHPLRAGYHQFLPAHRLQSVVGGLWPLNRVLERIWPLKLFCANLMIVAERRSVM